MKFVTNFKMTFLMMLFAAVVFASFSCLCFQGIEQENYLLLATDKGPKGEIGWTDVVLATIDKVNKQLIVDAMDATAYYSLAEKGPIMLGEAYAKGGEGLVVELLEQCRGIKVKSISKTTFDGLKEIAGAVGIDIDIPRIIRDSKAGKCVQLRCEQMALLKMSYERIRRMDYQAAYKLAEAVLSNIQTDISAIEALEIGTGLLGGRFVPKDAGHMAMNL